MSYTIDNLSIPHVTHNNYHGDHQELPVGPDAVWDLGREGKAGILQWTGTPPAVEEYVQLILKMIYDTSNLPEASFGRSSRGGGSSTRSSGGSSGIALQLALMPILERVAVNRIAWDFALRRIVEMSAF